MTKNARHPRAHRERLTSPSRIREEMRDVEKVAKELQLLARIVAESYEELYEASLMAVNGGQGDDADRVRPGKKTEFQYTDPTGDVAISGLHKHMRAQAHLVAGKARKLVPILDEAEALIKSAFNHADPDFQEKWRRARELNEAAG